MTAFYNIVICFMLFGFLGWVCETIFCSIQDRKPVNRGFLSGPICPVYGFGGLAVVYLLAPLRNNIIILFIWGMIVTTALEYITSYVLEKLFQTRWWDYTGFFLNIHGRVCLIFSLIFGGLSVVAVHLIYPPTAKLLAAIPDFLRPVLAWGMLFFIAADTYVTVRSVLQINGKLAEMQRITAEIREKLESYGEAKPNFHQWWERWREQRADREPKPEPMQGHLHQQLEELGERFEKAREAKLLQRRLMRAFPNMRSLQYQEQLARLRESFDALKIKKRKK